MITTCALVAGLAACSSGGDEATSTTQAAPPSVTVASTTLAPAPATTAAPAPTTISTTTPTTEPAATAPPTTETPLTTAPATLPSDLTDAEFEQLRNEVIEDLLESDRLFDEVRRHPTDPDIAEQFRAAVTPERYEFVVGEFVIFYVQNDLEERTNPDLPARNDYRPETFTVDLETGVASIDVCYLSSNLLYEIGGAEDGSDKLHDDRFAAVLLRTTAIFDGERWIEEGSETLSQAAGETECPAS